MFIINAEIRNKKSKSENRRLRIANKFPAVIYGGNALSISIKLDHNEIWNMQKKVEFYNEILVILLRDNKEKVKVQAVQRHAFKPKLIHIDFMRV